MNKFPFINTSCFFGDFPAVFVGYPPSVLVKNPFFSPLWAHFPLHTHKLRFSWFSSLYRRVFPISLSQKPFLFFFMCTFSPSYTQVLFFVIFPAFFIGDPLSVLVKHPYFSTSCAHIPLHTHKLLFWWFSSLFPRVPPSSFSQTPVLLPSCAHIPLHTHKLRFLVIVQPFS